MEKKVRMEPIASVDMPVIAAFRLLAALETPSGSHPLVEKAQTFSIRSREFVDLARCSGMRPLAVVRREIAPNMSSYLFMTFILLFGGAVLMAATLDFIGLGPTDVVSLGLMMNSAVHWSALHLGLWWWFVL